MTTAQMIETPRKTVKRRDRITGAVIILLGLVVLFFFNSGQTSETISTFMMTPGGITRGAVGNWLLPTRLVLMAIGGILIFLGAYQFLFGMGNRVNLLLGIASLLFVASFLIYVSAGKRLNLASLFNSALLMAVPIALASFAGILCERAGVINIAIEGMMLMGAMVGSIVGSITKDIWLALAAAMLGGGTLALVHAWLCVKYKVNQTISGTVINIFSTGMTSYISSMYLQNIQSLNKTPRFPNVSIPLLADIPFIGPILFNNSLFVFAMLILVFFLQFVLFKTRWGLRLRSVGEHPKAADTLGINVYKTQYTAVILGGLLAGFAGAYFSLGSVGRFDEGMTAGKGYIGMAAMIFGGWNPINSMLAAILFGFADALAASVSILGAGIPGQFINMLPYILTMVVLAGLVGGHSSGPAASGIPYTKEGS
jgi:simple sugar transport system permease protein